MLSDNIYILFFIIIALIAMVSFWLKFHKTQINEFKESNTVFEEENKWLKSALDLGHIGTYKWDLLLDTHYWSDTLYKIRELEKTTDINISISKFFENIHKDDRNILIKKIKKCSDLKTFTYEYRYNYKNGTIHWFKEKTTIINHENKNIVYGVVIDITEQKVKEKQLEYYALIDKLTGLPNRAGFDRELNKKIKDLKEKDCLILSFIDLNGFKKVNDTYGHESGDLSLRIVSSCLSSRATENDYVARLGGDEFVVLTYIKSVVDVHKEILKIEKFLKSVFDDVAMEAGELSVGAAIGISTYNNNSINTKDFLSEADKSMYAAKRSKERFKIVHYEDSLKEENNK